MKPRKVTTSRALAVPIVHDAAIAGPIGNGRLIPVLFIDTTKRPEVRELLRVHEHLSGGAVEFDWGLSRDSKDEAILFLRFVQPMEVDLILVFDVRSQAILVEGMLTAGLVYLQDGAAYLRDGEADKQIAAMIDSDRVLIELSDTGFRPYWDRFLLDRTTVLFKKRGLSRRTAPPAAEAAVRKMRRIVKFRMGPPRDTSEAKSTDGSTQS